MPLCEGCPRANDRIRKNTEEQIEEARATQEPVRIQLADAALAVLEFGDCPGKKEASPDNVHSEFGDNGYYQCQHPTESTAHTIISQGTLVLNRLTKEAAEQKEEASAVELSKEEPLLSMTEVMKEMADKSRAKRDRGEELSIQEAASIDYVYGSGFTQAAARDYFGFN